MNKESDFVEVRLTKAGEAIAGDGILRIIGSRHDFQFKAGETQRVTRAFDWLMVLSRERSIVGESLFELADGAAESIEPAGAAEPPPHE